MKNKVTSILIVLLLFLLCILIIVYSETVMESVSFSISIWKDNLFPAMFPFFLISELLFSYGFVDILGFFFQKIMNKLFYLPGECSFVLVGSMISGFPSSSKYTKDLVERKIISSEEGSYLMTFTHFSNPLFVIGTVGILLLSNKESGYIILSCHILANFIISLLFRRKRMISSKYVTFEEVLKRISNRRKNSSGFVTILTKAIWNTFKTMILLLGIITSFLIFTTIIQNVIRLDSISSSLLSGVLEVTQGIKSISSANISLAMKSSIIAAFISFGGLSVHFQVLSVLDDTKIKYKYFLFARVIHAFLAFVLVFLTFYIIS